MLSKYGLASSVAAGNYNIASSPLYFVRSGWILLPTTAGTFRFAGALSVWWSSRAYSSTTYAYDLYLQTTGVVSPSYDSNRYDGFPLRCLSTVLGM